MERIGATVKKTELQQAQVRILIAVVQVVSVNVKMRRK